MLTIPRRVNIWFRYALALECVCILLQALTYIRIHVLDASAIEFLGTLCIGVLIACWTAERFWATGFSRVVQLFLIGAAGLGGLTMIFSRMILAPAGASPAVSISIFVIALVIVLLQFTALTINTFMNISMARASAGVPSGTARRNANIVIAIAAGILSISPTLMSERTLPFMQAWWPVWAPALLVTCVLASQKVRNS